MELTEQQEKKLRHMLGAEHGRYRKDQWGFRNHYAANPNSPACAELKEMKEIGLVSEGGSSENMIFFHATEKGCKAIGLTKTQIDRAFDR